MVRLGKRKAQLIHPTFDDLLTNPSRFKVIWSQPPRFSEDFVPTMRTKLLKRAVVNQPIIDRGEQDPDDKKPEVDPEIDPNDSDSDNPEDPEDPRDDSDDDDIDDPDVNPDDPDVNPDDPEINPDDPEINPDGPDVTPDEPEINPDDPDTNPDNPEDPEIKPENPDKKPEIPEIKPPPPNPIDDPNIDPTKDPTNPESPNFDPSKIDPHGPPPPDLTPDEQKYMQDLLDRSINELKDGEKRTSLTLEQEKELRDSIGGTLKKLPKSPETDIILLGIKKAIKEWWAVHAAVGIDAGVIMGVASKSWMDSKQATKEAIVRITEELSEGLSGIEVGSAEAIALRNAATDRIKREMAKTFWERIGITAQRGSSELVTEILEATLPLYKRIRQLAAAIKHTTMGALELAQHAFESVPPGLRARFWRRLTFNSRAAEAGVELAELGGGAAGSLADMMAAQSAGLEAGVGLLDGSSSILIESLGSMVDSGAATAAGAAAGPLTEAGLEELTIGSEALSGLTEGLVSAGRWSVRFGEGVTTALEWLGGPVGVGIMLGIDTAMKVVTKIKKGIKEKEIVNKIKPFYDTLVTQDKKDKELFSRVFGVGQFDKNRNNREALNIGWMEDDSRNWSKNFVKIKQGDQGVANMLDRNAEGIDFWRYNFAPGFANALRAREEADPKIQKYWPSPAQMAIWYKNTRLQAPAAPYDFEGHSPKWWQGLMPGAMAPTTPSWLHVYEFKDTYNLYPVPRAEIDYMTSMAKQFESKEKRDQWAAMQQKFIMSVIYKNAMRDKLGIDIPMDSDSHPKNWKPRSSTPGEMVISLKPLAKP